MKVTDVTRSALALRRFRRAMLRDGWEHVDEGGGMMWELHRGWRTRMKITAVAIDITGQSLWMKVT